MLSWCKECAVSFTKAYIETNAINHAFLLNLSGFKLKELLDNKGLTPAVGLHAVYELARTFLNEAGTQTGTELFSILRDLDPFYQLPPATLHNQEIIKLRTGAAVLPVLDQLNLTATKHEVERLACGFFDEKAKNFIAGREEDVKVNHPRFASDYIAQIKQTNRSQFKKKSLRTFDQVYAELENQIPDLIYHFLDGKVSRAEALELTKRMPSFPAIRATARSNVYLSAICIIHKDVPSKDKLDDYRHIIEASYCDVFVTNDAQLSRTIPHINPDQTVLLWDELMDI
jgi:hypothetical protein